MYVPRLKTRYRQEVVPALQKELGYSSPMQVPTLTKVTINQGLGAAIGNPNLLKTALEELTLIAGQRAVPTKAKKAVSNFKLRVGMPIGARVTLRGNRMWDFVDRLFSLTLPRTRNFQGLSPNAFDKQGNYTLGIKEQTVFLAIRMDKVERLTGMNITFGTSTDDIAANRAMLKAIGCPFAKTTN